MMTAELPKDLMPFGRIVRLQVQREKIKSGTKPNERYTPEEHLMPVTALRLDSGGVTGVMETGELVPDVHHRDHPRSRFRGENGISLGFTGHYMRMRERFGGHIVEGIAGESVLVEHHGRVRLNDIARGIVIAGKDGRRIAINTWEIARPCNPFSKFWLQFPESEKPDLRVTDALRFLDTGMRGFYGTYRADQPADVELRIGDTVYLSDT